MHQKEYCVIDVAPEENGLTWIRLEGRIDSITAPDVEKCLNELISSGQRTLALDMQSVHYMSSMGLRVLLAALKQLKKADGELLICKPPAFVQELFDMSGFQTCFVSFPIGNLLNRNGPVPSGLNHRSGSTSAASSCCASADRSIQGGFGSSAVRKNWPAAGMKNRMSSP